MKKPPPSNGCKAMEGDGFLFDGRWGSTAMTMSVEPHLPEHENPVDTGELLRFIIAETGCRIGVVPCFAPCGLSGDGVAFVYL